MRKHDPFQNPQIMSCTVCFHRAAVLLPGLHWCVLLGWGFVCSLVVRRLGGSRGLLVLGDGLSVRLDQGSLGGSFWAWLWPVVISGFLGSSFMGLVFRGCDGAGPHASDGRQF